MAEPGLRSIPTLVGDAVRELRDLVGGEIGLFRTEIAQGIHRISLGLSLLLMAAVLAIAGSVHAAPSFGERHRRPRAVGRAGSADCGRCLPRAWRSVSGYSGEARRPCPRWSRRGRDGRSNRTHRFSQIGWTHERLAGDRLEQDVEASRGRLDRTLADLQARFNRPGIPRDFADLRRSGQAASETVERVVAEMRVNPVPVHC